MVARVMGLLYNVLDSEGDMMLRGENVVLGAIREEDIDVLASWYENTDFLRFYDFHPAIPKTREQLRKIYEDGPGESFVPLAIRLNANDRLIGLIELDGISVNNRFSWISIGFGDDSHRGKGYGYEALSLAVEFAFRELNLERLQLNVLSYNKAAIRLYEKLGFQKEGTYREAVLRDGKRHDLLLYGILEREWKQK